MTLLNKLLSTDKNNNEILIIERVGNLLSI